jgi:hypothetical protein
MYIGVLVMQFVGAFCVQYLASTALCGVKWVGGWSNSSVGAVGGERGEHVGKVRLGDKMCLAHARKERYSPPYNRPHRPRG